MSSSASSRMNLIDIHPSHPAPATHRSARTATLLWPFALTIFLGAFLLFQIEPIIARYILPWFGGAPGVWTACLLFFQVLLLAGYAYAHVLQKLPPKTQALTHLALLTACLLSLNVIPPDAWKPNTVAEIANPTWRIIALLATHVGLPFFALSSTGPLLQAWVSRHNGGRAPYRLYALSNVGSLLALISYPFIIEPLLGRMTQAGVWSWGMRLFILACAACTLLAWRSKNAQIESPAANAAKTADNPPIPKIHRALWFLLPASASLLLLATTNKISQDIAVVPFLWVLPLALYLLSFILTFDSHRWYWRRFYMLAFAAGLLLVVRSTFKTGPDKDGIIALIALYSGVFFAACMIFHGELVRLKPPARHLTAFYLMIAAGGAAGSIFVAVIAPLLFSDYRELEIGLLLCGALLTLALFLDHASPFYDKYLRFLWIPLAGGLLIMGILLQMLNLQLANLSLVARYRSFYGVLSIHEFWDNPVNHYLMLQHGRITHGLQFVNSSLRYEPTTYFEKEAGVGLAIRQLADPGPRHIGVFGLGIGTIAAYGRPGDRISFYEINPQVEMIARKHFNYLGDSKAQIDVILGDGRLSLESQPPQAFDLLVLDAFNGDAPPVHLLTREAFAIYLKNLKPNGVIAADISNRCLDFEPVITRIAESYGLHAVMVTYAKTAFGSKWILVTRDPSLFQKLHSEVSTIRPATDKLGALWTDDHSSLFPILRKTE